MTTRMLLMASGLRLQYSLNDMKYGGVKGRKSRLVKCAEMQGVAFLHYNCVGGGIRVLLCRRLYDACDARRNVHSLSVQPISQYWLHLTLTSDS